VEDREWPAYVAEFIGTFLLVFFICAILCINSAGGIGVTDYAVIGLLHAFVLAPASTRRAGSARRSSATSGGTG